MDERDSFRLRRRGFFGLVGAGALAAASTVPAMESAAADTESPDEKRKPRYRETEEVRTFYRVNSYPR